MHELKDMKLKINTTRVTDMEIKLVYTLCNLQWNGFEFCIHPFTPTKMFLASSDLFNTKVLSGYYVTLNIPIL